MSELILVSETFSPETGWGTVANALAYEAERAGWHVIKVASDGTGSLGTPLVYKVSDGLWKRRKAASDWSDWIVNQPAKIVHFITEPQFWLATRTKKICVGTVHGTYAAVSAHGPIWSRFQFARGMDRLAKVAAVSAFTGRVVESRWKNKIIVIPNGLDRAITKEPRKEIGWQTGSDHRILHVGAIKRRKGCLELIKGFAEYAKSFDDAVLAMIGPIQEGEYMEQIRKAIRSMGLENKIMLTGRVARDELLAWYNWCHVMALLPINGQSFEGFGLVYLEANAFGKPVLGLKKTAAEEAIGPQTGILAASANPKDISEGLQSVLDQDRKWDFGSWLAEHSWENVFKKYQEIYLSLSEKN
ncbi:MAG: glycosyltransferase family 4 protein [Patescibacteria group bacterium]|jgi:phosphatidylinositol alpha-1,6-mannosyltransferase